jgi:hypothetical protein
LFWYSWLPGTGWTIGFSGPHVASTTPNSAASPHSYWTSPSTRRAAAPLRAASTAVAACWHVVAVTRFWIGLQATSPAAATGIAGPRPPAGTLTARVAAVTAVREPLRLRAATVTRNVRPRSEAKTSRGRPPAPRIEVQRRPLASQRRHRKV